MVYKFELTSSGSQPPLKQKNPRRIKIANIEHVGANINSSSSEGRSTNCKWKIPIPECI